MADTKKMEQEFATKMTNLLQKKKAEDDKKFEEIVGSLETMLDTEDPSVAIFSSLFELDDEEFKVVSDLFLPQLEKSLMEEQALFDLARVMNIKGITPEDMIGQYEEILLSLDSDDFKKEMSPVKIDFIKQYIYIIINSINEMKDVAHRSVLVPIQVEDYGTIPQYARVGDAGMDIVSPQEYDIPCGESVIINTGLRVAIPRGYAILVQPRSGLSAKTHLRVANTPGLIDSGYRGEIGVILENNEPPIKDITYDFDENGKITITSILHGSPCHIDKGQKIAQLRLVEVPNMVFKEVESLDITERGEGGFGSTDGNVPPVEESKKENEQNQN